MSRRSDWDSRVEESKHEFEANRLRMLSTLAMAEVPAGKLANGDEWRLYQQAIQNLIDVSKAELEEIKQGLIDPGLVSADDITAKKNRGAIVQERISVLSGVLELPKKIQEDAHAAKEWVEKEQWRQQAS